MLKLRLVTLKFFYDFKTKLLLLRMESVIVLGDIFVLLHSNSDQIVHVYQCFCYRSCVLLYDKQHLPR